MISVKKKIVPVLSGGAFFLHPSPGGTRRQERTEEF